jgi:hypothetical protein
LHGELPFERAEIVLLCSAVVKAGRKRWGGIKSQNLDFRQKKFGF